jgi:Predicted transcriptional regulator
MIRERFKEMDLKITDLADYLHMSRTTIYSFMDAYDKGNKSVISQKVLKLFDYVIDNPLSGKKNVMSFLLSDITGDLNRFEKSENASFSQIIKYMTDYPESPKTEFFHLAVSTSDFDSVLEYLLKVYPLLRNRRLTDAEIEFIKPYDDIRNIIDNNKEN